jgi:hypothetical protein
MKTFTVTIKHSRTGETKEKDVLAYDKGHAQRQVAIEEGLTGYWYVKDIDLKTQPSPPPQETLYTHGPQWLSRVTCENYWFEICCPKNSTDWWLQVSALRPDNDAPYVPSLDGGHPVRPLATQKGRKWRLSRRMTFNEFAQTVLKAILTFEEHEIRERFKVDGVRVFEPHQDLRMVVAAGSTMKVILDNDCFGIGWTEGLEDVRWLYDAHPDKLLRALLRKLGVAVEEV